HHRGRPPAKVHSSHSHCFVHRHQEIAGPESSAFAAEGLVKSLSEHDSNVFHCVMLIHVEIATRPERQVESSVVREELQHMVEEPDAGGHLIAPASLNGQRDLYLCFFAGALDTSSSHGWGSPCAIAS